MPFLRNSIDERDEHVSIQTELGAEWKFQTGPPIPLELLHADLNQTLGTLTLLASGGQPTIIAGLSQTLGLLTVSSGTTATNAGNLSKTFGGLTGSNAGTVATSATFSKTLGALTLLASEGMGVLSQVSGSDFTTSSLTPVDITGLSFAASASKLYEVDVLLKVAPTGTLGLKCSLNYSAAGATLNRGLIIAPTSANAGATVSLDALGTITYAQVFCTLASDSTVFIKAIISTGANAGNITATIQKTSSGSLTVYIGSRMIVTALT